jgi:hypothetical protein
MAYQPCPAHGRAGTASRYFRHGMVLWLVRDRGENLFDAQ